MSDLSNLQILPAPSWAGRIDRSAGPNECWPWRGSTMTNGYGQSRVCEGGRWRSAGAHQVAYYMATGRWERKAEGRLVRHMCHNRLCCNPAHLRGGTHADNSDDRAKRVRGLQQVVRNPFLLPVVGIANDPFWSPRTAEARQ